MSVQGKSPTASERPSEWDPFWKRALNNSRFTGGLVKLTVREQHEQKDLVCDVREIGDVRVWIHVDGQPATHILGYRYDQISAVEAL